MSLYPTKHRIKLLVAVREREVKHWPASAGDPAWDCWGNAYGDLAVTSRIADQVREGWVQLGAGDLYELTPAGERVLREQLGSIDE